MSVTQKDQSQAEQRSSNQFPVAVKILSAPDAEKKAAEGEQHRAESASEESGLIDATYALVYITGILAAFTGGLLWATYKLFREAKETSKRQAGEIQRTLALTEKQIDLAARQADLTEKQLGLEKWQYLVTHRPKLVIRNISLHDGLESSAAIGGPARIEFIIANIRGSRATIIECSASFEKHCNGLPAIPPYSAATDMFFNPIREAGQSDSAVVLPLYDSNWLEVIQTWSSKSSFTNADQGSFYFFGYVRYADDLGTIRCVAFCRRYNPATKRFIRVEDPEYEYAD